MNIASEMKTVSIFSIEVDFTQDTAVIDQLTICDRYIIRCSINVRLLRMVTAQKSTDLALYDRLKLEKFQLSTAQIVGCSFFGAARISGQCNRLQAQLKKYNPNMQCFH